MAGIEVKTMDGAARKIDENDIADLRARIRGGVVLPTDAEYDETRAIWNAMIDRRPALIARCSGTADVIEAIRFARKQKLLVSVRGAGHNIAGKAVWDGAMMIDLSTMRAVQVDPDHKTVRAGGGATLGDLDHETQAYGLAVPVGINSTTGIAGLTLGGGFGWISRSCGLTVDNLVGAEVVTAAGERLYCDSDNESDLFWAIRGGSGNFGVVTSFEFKCHPVGPQVFSGAVVHPFEAAAQLLQDYRKLSASFPEQLTVWCVMRQAPPLPFLPEEHHGKLALIFAGLYNGPMEEGEKAMAKVRALGQPWGDGMGPHPFVGFQAAFDPLLTPGARNYWKSHNFTELSDGLIDKVLHYAGRLPSPQSEIFFGQLGGVINRVPAEATAYPHRDAEYVMNVHTRWEGKKQDKACVAWARELYDATAPFATGGVYVNFMSEGEEDRVAEGAYGPNYRRLAAIKAKYDPDNFFSLNQNITPKR